MPPGHSLFRLILPGCDGKDETMSWKTPKIVEIALGAEINSYVCAGKK